MYASDFRRIGRAALKGNWAISIVITLVAAMFGAQVYGNSSSNMRQMLPDGAYQPPWWLNPVGTLLAYLGIAAIIWAVVAFFVGGAAELGHKLYYTRLVRGEGQSPFGTLFERMSIIGRALGLRLLIGLFTSLWTLLFIIPGIVAAYRYAMAPYIMAEDPDMSALDAINESKSLMMGHKAELFFLHLSFFGWALLAMLTLGIGNLWLQPYIAASEAAFYLELTGRMPSGGISAV